MPESKARLAAATARLTSSVLPAAILALMRPSRDETESKVAPLAASTYLPSMNN